MTEEHPKHLETIIAFFVAVSHLDTEIFVGAAFWAVLEPELLMQVIVSNYVFKCGVEILFTPGTYILTGFLKRTEGIDVFDRETKFNPFSFR